MIQDYEQVQLQEEAMDAVKRRNKMKAETVTYVNGLGGFRQQQIRVIPEAAVRRGTDSKITEKDFKSSSSSSSSSSSDSEDDQASRLKKELALLNNQSLPPPQHRFLAKDREEHPSEHDDDNDDCCAPTISSPHENENMSEHAKILQKFNDKKRKVERHRIEMERNFSAELLRSSESKLLVKEILKCEKQEQVAVNQHFGSVDGHVRGGKKQNETDIGAASISQNHISSFTSASIEERILQKKRDLFSYIRLQQKELSTLNQRDEKNGRNNQDLLSTSSNSSKYLFNNNNYMNDDWAAKIAAKAKQNLVLTSGNIFDTQQMQNNNTFDDVAADRLLQQKIQALASVETKGVSSWVEVEAKEQQQQSSSPQQALLVCSPNSLLSSSLRQQNNNSNNNQKTLVRKNTHPQFNVGDNLHSHHQLDSTVKSLTGNSFCWNETSVTNNSTLISTNNNNFSNFDDGAHLDDADYKNDDYENDDHSEKSTAVHLRQVARRHHVERQIGMKRRIAEHLSNCRQKLSMLEAEEEQAAIMKKRAEETERRKNGCSSSNGELHDDSEGNDARRVQEEERDFLRNGGKIYRISTSNQISKTTEQDPEKWFDDDDDEFTASRRETVVLLTEKSIVDKFNVLERRRASLIELRKKSLEAI